MPARPKRGATAGPESGTLLGPDSAPPAAPREREGGATDSGSVAAAVSRAIIASHDSGERNPRLEGLEELARALAASIDGSAHLPFALAQLAPKLLEVLVALRLTPEPKSETDSLTKLLSALNVAT